MKPLLENTPVTCLPFFAIIPLLISAGTIKAKDLLKLDCLRIDGRTVENVRVTKVTPVEVTIVYGANVVALPREDLPADLKPYFPYDAKAAESYLQKEENLREKKAIEARSKYERAQQDARVALLRQRQALKSQIEWLERELSKVHDQVDASRPRFRRRLSAAEIQDLERLTARQKELRGQIGAMNDRIVTIDRQLTSMPGVHVSPVTRPVLAPVNPIPTYEEPRRRRRRQ